MKRLPVAIVAVLVVLAIAAFATGGFGLWRGGDKGLTLYGNVDIREVDMAFEVGGRIDEVAVEEGDRVKEGDLLAAVDPARNRDRLAQAEAQIAQAEAQLARLRNGNRPQDIAQSRARVAAAEAALANARAAYTRREPLVESGAVSRNVWDQTRAELRRAEAQLAEASQAASLASAGARSEDIAAAEAQVEAARAQRAAIDTDLGDTKLEAPVDGTVVTRAIEPGSLVQPGTTAFTIAIDRPMRVRAYVAEPDLSRIQPGMKVVVRADGNSKEYQGTIGYISPRAEFTPKSVETEDLRTDLVYQLRIVVSDPDDGLRQGQPVSVSVPQARAAAEG
ncbi:HlyD family efflux transporter periplasmic adaptor subunit [Aurantiacibacter flavus]|uniref:HlyD family efflux transporter periplasmic adaptor subunit n=1 Tax=Aurantiacibacter flavus TaxID=3145232 RepID=A0ABV0CRZ2_9SPHN